MERGAAATIEWRIQPIVMRTPQFVLALLALVVFFALVSWIEGEMVIGALASLILFAALINAFLPSSYRIDDEGLLVDHPLRRRPIPWREIRRVSFDASGALVNYGSGRGREVSITFPRQSSRVDEIAAALRARAGASGGPDADRRAGAEAESGTRASFTVVDRRPVEREWRPS